MRAWRPPARSARPSLRGYTTRGTGVSVVNPMVIHAYARAHLLRTKTDALDAALIADYTATQQPALWTPPTAEIRQLQALVRRLDALYAMRTQETNRLAAGVSVAAVQASIEAVLAHLDEQVAQVRQLIREHIDRHSPLRQQRDLLTTIPGIGEATAAVLMAELFAKSYASARQAAAFAGLVPHIRRIRDATGACAPLQDRHKSPAEGAVPSCADRVAGQPHNPGHAGTPSGGRQAANGDRRGRHAEADPPRLRRAQVWSRFRTCRCPPLTANTVSTVVAVPVLPVCKATRAGRSWARDIGRNGDPWNTEGVPATNGADLDVAVPQLRLRERWSARPAPTGCQVGRQPNEGHPMPTGLEAWARCPAARR